jgi:hypothetical protein
MTRKTAYQGLKDYVRGKKDEVDDQMENDFFLTFSSVHGRRVLAHMLRELHVFDEVIDDQEVIMQNYGKRILGYMGIIKDEQVEDVVDMFVKYAETQIKLRQGGSNYEKKD